MKKFNKNETGFTVIEFLLLLIFLAIVVFIGVYVAHNHNSTKSNNTSSTSSGSNSKPANETSAAASTRAVTILNATQTAVGGNQTTAPEPLASYVDAHVSDGYFTSSFKTAEDNGTGFNNSGTYGITCTNGIPPASFGAGQATLSGDSATVSLTFLDSNGSDISSNFSQLPQATMKYVNDNWSVGNYACVNNPNQSQ